MKMLRNLYLVTAGLMMAAVASAQNLNVWLEPATQNALVGNNVTIDVYANSADSTALTLSDAYLAITWDPTVLTNATPAVVSEPAPWSQSYWAPGQPVNSNLMDGDAQRELLGELPPNQPVAPVGVMRDAVNRIKVTSFQFTVNSLAPTTSVKLVNSVNGAPTEFYKGNFQIGRWNLIFEDTTYSEALVTPVPEPATMAILGLGAAALLRRRRAR